jgi:hypothetical protein
MVTVHLSEAEARKLGIDVKSKVRQRRTAPGPYWTICTGPNGCHLEFHSRKAENDHVEETHHARYELILEKA